MLHIVRTENNPFKNYRLYIQQRSKINEWLKDYQKDPTDIYIWHSPFEILDKNIEIRKQFNQAFYYKCSYCEVKLEKNNGQLDLFRPRIVELKNEEKYSIKNYNYFYHWLSWEWSNFYLSCKQCNINKGNCFLVKKKRARPGTYNLTELSKEEPLLIDPCSDNPSEDLIFFKDGTIHPRQSSERGKATIEILDLNRKELVGARKNEANKLIEIVDSYEQKLNKKISDMNQSEIEKIVDDLMPYWKIDNSFTAMKRKVISELLDPFFKPIFDLNKKIYQEKNTTMKTHSSSIFSTNDKFTQIYNYYQYHYGIGDNIGGDKNTNNNK